MFVRFTPVLLIVAFCGPDLAAEVQPRDQLKFEQEKAAAHMRELEERMFRLGELLREQQPDDSARLLMAFRTAREKLIVDQMRQIDELLTKMDLQHAGDEQKQVVRKLEELKELLLSRNLDLAFRLDQLRKLRQGQQTLRRVIEKEVQHEKRSGELAQARKNDPAASQPAKEDEERNRRAADDLSKSLAQIGPVGQSAGQKIGQASGSMTTAAGKLGEGKPGEACPKQGEAVAKLREAENELAQSEKKLLEQMEPLVRNRVIENLTAMLTEQRKVREATERLSPKVAQGQRPAVLAVQRLAANEQQITELAEQTIDLVEETQFSIVLPPALGSVKDRMVFVGGELKNGYANETIVGTEKSIEADLAALLDAMKASAKYARAGKAGQCKSCGSQPNKLLAEVKMLRWMQASVLGETQRIDKQISSSPQPSPQLLDQASKLHHREDQIRQAANGLHHRTCPDCVKEFL